MPQNKNLQHRSHQTEQLDNPNLQGTELEETLQNLGTVNSLLGNIRSLSKSILKVLNSKKQDKYRIIDLGCGGGDALKYLAQICRKKNIKVEFVGIDFNAHSLQYAQKQAADFPEIEWLQGDILDPNFELPECDVLMSSHFMYHFEDAQLVGFLKRQKHRVNTAIVISELQRSKMAFVLFQIFAPLLRFSKIAYEDGLLAIQRSFIRTELEAILKEAEMERFSLKWKWAFRYELVVWV